MEKWIQKLIEDLFEKAKTNSRETKPYGLAKYLSEHVQSARIEEKTFIRYHGGYITKTKRRRKPVKSTRDAFSVYLGYKDFDDFIKENESEKEAVKRKHEAQIKKLNNRFLYSLISGIALACGVIFFMVKYYEKNCMIWVGDHYEKIKCSGTNNEKRLDELVLENFYKIDACDTTTFFKGGKEVIWYDKSNNTLEYFTYPGIHPLNGKTLKPISDHIIDKYVSSCTFEKDEIQSTRNNL
ncbi:hypothetical protein OOZ15_17585 [Galbibacter sp. EGI 63066]|uniref:hypothetical protein n=1 Tax=Galbibacter sp. EGI 63066 TaxID=2993559 RepID=UPI002249975B|nr:hypothetical protein [Galbibacter sp. EGI 63066]MCX2681770.1 hypothetical protein [Galbibacter sp. EGI 63066]